MKRLYHNNFTKISHRNQPIIKMILNADHSYFILTGMISGALPGAPQCSKLLDASR